jgi:hypothetical protein
MKHHNRTRFNQFQTIIFNLCVFPDFGIFQLLLSALSITFNNLSVGFYSAFLFGIVCEEAGLEKTHLRKD